MDISLGELADRLSILRLKCERLPDGTPFEQERLAYACAFTAGAAKCSAQLNSLSNAMERLYEVNGLIWNLESDIRMGKEGLLGLEEVGRRAIAIRDINESRVKLKNKINELSGTGWQESKSTWRV